MKKIALFILCLMLIGCEGTTALSKCYNKMTWAATSQDTTVVLNTTVKSDVNGVNYRCDEVINKRKR